MDLYVCVRQSVHVSCLAYRTYKRQRNSLQLEQFYSENVNSRTVCGALPEIRNKNHMNKMFKLSISNH